MSCLVLCQNMTYYDRDSDIVYVELSDAQVDHSVEREWGLLDVDPSGATVGAECWNASQRLPAELLAALPAPPKPVAAGR
jgi:uncharacterized protein YuzE